MKKFEEIGGGVCAAKGFKASGVYCGIKQTMNGNIPDGNDSPVGNHISPLGKKNDIAMVAADVVCNAAGVYTSNKVKGAPVIVTRENLARTGGKARAVIVNSGNANTAAAGGEGVAREMCRLTAEALGIKPEEVIVASTGVIGQVLPIAPIEWAVPRLEMGLCYEGNEAAATAIMTTDTVKKEYAVEFEIGGKVCRIGGMAKGSGMIHPNMATTLNFITTDCNISVSALQAALSENVKVTYNCLCVDGDQSTNDMCMVMASGLAGNEEIDENSGDFGIFKDALYEVMAKLTRMLAKDGEGATRLITCICGSAPSLDIAIAAAKSVIRSPLVKCAMFGADANCGRILCAIGYTEEDFDISHVDIYYSSAKGKIKVCGDGVCIPFSEEIAKEILLEDEVDLLIELNTGKFSATAWGCDMTYDYVKINGDYRS